MRVNKLKVKRTCDTLKKMLLTATFSSLAFVLSTSVYFPQMAPFQHCINVITAVFLGPWYGTLAALVTGILRMMIGRSILAITGAIFGAFLAGVFYKYTKKFYMALIGEVIGTGIISAIVSYPIMKYVYGIPLDKFYYYIPFFLPSSLIGSFLGFLILRKLRKLEKF